MEFKTKRKTIFCDIDGVLLQHGGDITQQHLNNPKILEGSLDVVREWVDQGSCVILCTGRKESTRAKTEEQLSTMGIIYDQLIMGIGDGLRVLINDTKLSEPETPTAVAFTVRRNAGLSGYTV